MISSTIELMWSSQAWDDYLHWQQKDKQVLKRINALIRDISGDPFAGMGAPEQLRHHWQGHWSRRINREHRLVYRVDGDTLMIVQCRYHY